MPAEKITAKGIKGKVIANEATMLHSDDVIVLYGANVDIHKFLKDLE